MDNKPKLTIEELEKRIEELERRPVYVPQPYPVPQQIPPAVPMPCYPPVAPNTTGNGYPHWLYVQTSTY